MCGEGDVHTEVVPCGNVVSRQHVHCHAKTGMLMLCHESLQKLLLFHFASFLQDSLFFVYICD